MFVAKYPDSVFLIRTLSKRDAIQSMYQHLNIGHVEHIKDNQYKAVGRDVYTCSCQNSDHDEEHHHHETIVNFDPEFTTEFELVELPKECEILFIGDAVFGEVDQVLIDDEN